MRRWYWRCRCCGFWPWSSPALSSECGPLPLGEGGQRRTGRRLRGGPQPALEALYQGRAVLVRPLVIPESPDLLVGESVYSLGDLIDVHLVVAGYREGGRLRGPLGALGRGVHGAGRGVGHRSDYAWGLMHYRLSTPGERALHSLPGDALQDRAGPHLSVHADSQEAGEGSRRQPTRALEHTTRRYYGPGRGEHKAGIVEDLS